MAHEIGHLVHLAHYRRHNKDTQHSHYQHGFKQSDSNRQPALLHAKQPLVILHKRLKDVRHKPRHQKRQQHRTQYVDKPYGAEHHGKS